MIVFRVTNSGNTANARPCFNCLNMIKDIGIKKVFYTTDNNNEIVSENVNNMISIQSSSVTRMIASKNPSYVNRETYFETLLKKQFPEKVKKKNLYFFINHNFKNIFPNYDIQINTKKNIVIILNNNNSIVLQSIIIP